MERIDSDPLLVLIMFPFIVHLVSDMPRTYEAFKIKLHYARDTMLAVRELPGMGDSPFKGCFKGTAHI